jgi:hypothetical protein
MYNLEITCGSNLRYLKAKTIRTKVYNGYFGHVLGMKLTKKLRVLSDEPHAI